MSTPASPSPEELRRRRRAMRLSFLGTLAAGVGMIVVFAAPTPVAAKDRAAYRRAHRAYDGAPPAIPHAVRALSRQNCRICRDVICALKRVRDRSKRSCCSTRAATT